MEAKAPPRGAELQAPPPAPTRAGFTASPLPFPRTPPLPSRVASEVVVDARLCSACCCCCCVCFIFPALFSCFCCMLSSCSPENPARCGRGFGVVRCIVTHPSRGPRCCSPCAPVSPWMACTANLELCAPPPDGRLVPAGGSRGDGAAIAAIRGDGSAPRPLPPTAAAGLGSTGLLRLISSPSLSASRFPKASEIPVGLPSSGWSGGSEGGLR